MGTLLPLGSCGEQWLDNDAAGDLAKFGAVLQGPQLVHIYAA